MQLLEREDAHAVLSGALAGARTGRGRLVLVSGEAGIGKSALVRAFAAGQLAGAHWVLGSCEALSTPEPLAPFREIASMVGGRLGRLFALAASPDPLEVLAALKDCRHDVLIIEDLHWADQASLDLLGFVARRIGQLPLLLVVTYRGDEVTPHHQLHRVLGGLATSPDVSRIALAPLSLAAVQQLSGAGPIDATTLHQRTRGNPFFVTEVLSVGRLDTIPDAVRDVIGERLARVDPSTRDFLRFLSVVGRLEPRVLARLGPEMPGQIDAGLAVGLLRNAATGTEFSHDLARQAVLETVPAHRLPEFHARALAALTGVGVTDAGRLAAHAKGAGDAGAIAHWSLRAAQAAAEAGAQREAARHYADALAATEAPDARAELLEAYGSVLAALDRNADAIEALRECVAHWRMAADARREAMALCALAAPLLTDGQNGAAAECEDRAIALLEPAGPSRDLAIALRMRAHHFMLERDKAQALHLGRRAIGMADALGDRATLAAANLTVAITLLVADDPEGRKYLERSTQLARELRLDSLLASSLINAGSSYGEQYRFADAEQFLRHAIVYSAERDFDGHLNYSRAWLALVQMYTGRLSEAAESGTALLRSPDVGAISRIMALVAVGRALNRRGLTGGAALLDEALALAIPTGALQRLAPVRLARAEAAWLAGDAETAAAEASTVWGQAAGHRHQWHSGEIAYWQRKGENAGTVPHWIAPAWAAQLGGDWREAARLWAERGCPYEEARALAEGDHAARLAALAIFERLGARPAADLLRQQMRQAGDDYVPRGPRPKTRQHDFGLTARQQEIAVLLGEGLSNAEIALKLRISAKTCEHHVSAVLAKLGVAGRGEVAARLGTADRSRREG